MNVNVRLDKNWLIHGRPADQHITGLVEAEVVAVQKSTIPASYKWRRPEKAGYSALLRMPEGVFPRTSPAGPAPLVWMSISSALNPGWKPPEFAPGVARVNIIAQAPPE